MGWYIKNVWSFRIRNSLVMEVSIETKKSLNNLVRCFRDALDLRTLQIHAKNKNYKQVEVNALVSMLLFDVDTLFDNRLNDFSVSSRKKCLDRIYNRIAIIQKYIAIFENLSNNELNLIDDDLLPTAQDRLLTLLNFSVDLEKSL